MEAYFQSLSRLKASIEKSRARMVLVWIPPKARVYLPMLPKERIGKYV